MTLEQTLTELKSRREGYKTFRQAVEDDLARQRADRLASEEAAILQLILKAAAEGASTGQIKRSYGTKDHNTIARKLRDYASQIEAIRSAPKNDLGEMPGWLTFVGDQILVDFGNDGVATFDVTEMAEGGLMFITEEPLWNEDYTVKNKAVELLDGKTEGESEEAGVAAKFWRAR